LFGRIVHRNHPCILALIDPPGAKISRSLARNIPEQILCEIPRPHIDNLDLTTLLQMCMMD